MTTEAKVEYMLFPRALALSEVVWSPREARSWPSFVARLPASLTRLNLMEVNYRYPREVALPALPASGYATGRGDW